MPQDSNLIKAAHAASLIYRNEHRSTTLRQCIARAADYHGVVRGQLTVYMTLKMPHLLDTMPLKQECCTNAVQLGLELAL